jgi:integrase
MSSGSLRQRSPGSWQLKFDIGADVVTGRRRVRYATVRGSKRDALQELRRLLGAVDQGNYVDPGKLTLGAWLVRWLAETRHTVSPKTFERYDQIVQQHLVPALGDIALSKLSPMHIQGYYTDALGRGRRDGKGGLSARTVSHHDRVLHIALKRARKLRLIATNPTEDATTPKAERREIVVPDAAEMARLFTELATTRLYAPAALALATGMRRGEVLALRWADVDLAGGVLQVVRSVEQTKDGLRFKGPKSARGRRSIALPDVAVALLREHRAQQAEERLSLGLGGRNADDLVFTKPDGTLISPNIFSVEFGRVAKRAGVRTNYHGLRHAHLTALLQAGVHPKIASERAGHSTVGITLDLYSHVTVGMQQQAAQQIDGALREAFGGNRVANPDRLGPKH